MKIKHLLAAVALLGLSALPAADRNLTMHFVIDYSLKMQQPIPRSDKTIAIACYDEFVAQMEALSKDEAFKHLRYRYDTVLQHQPKYRAYRGEWLHSSKRDQKTSGAIADFPSNDWLYVSVVTKRPHLTPFNMLQKRYENATETTDWDKYVKNMMDKTEDFGGDVKDTLYVFFVYEKPKDELVGKLNKMLEPNRSRCIFIPMRRGTQDTGTPENNVKRGFDEVAKLFKDEFGKNAKITCDAGDRYPGKYTFRLSDLESDLPDGLEINWRVSRDGKPFRAIAHKNGETPLMMMELQLDEAGTYVVDVELKTSFRSIPLRHSVEIRNPDYKFAVEVRGRSYGDGETVSVESAGKLTAKVKCEVTPKRERGNLRVKVKRGMYDLGETLELYPNDRGDIALYDLKRDKVLRSIGFDIRPPAPEAPLSLDKVTADGREIPVADGVYAVTLPQGAQNAYFTFTLNRAAAMRLDGKDWSAAPQKSWSAEIPAGDHLVVFRAADGKSAEARVRVTGKIEPEEAVKPSPASALTLDKVTADDTEIAAVGGVYDVTLAPGAQKANVTFTLNRAAAMRLDGKDGSAARQKSWSVEIPAGDHLVVFRAADGKSTDARIGVRAAEERPLELKKVTVNGKDIRVDVNSGAYVFTLAAGAKKANFKFTLNLPADMAVGKVSERGARRTSWLKDFPAGDHSVVFRAAGGKPVEVKIKVNNPVKPVDPKKPEDPPYWLYILLGIAAVVAAAIAAKKIFGGKIFELSLSVNQQEYQKLERPLAKGRYRIDGNMFGDCLGEFTIILAQEKGDDDVLPTLVFELPRDWALSVGGRSCALNNGVSEKFIVGRDEYLLSTSKGMMKLKITLVEK